MPGPLVDSIQDHPLQEEASPPEDTQQPLQATFNKLPPHQARYVSLTDLIESTRHHLAFPILRTNGGTTRCVIQDRHKIKMPSTMHQSTLGPYYKFDSNSDFEFLPTHYKLTVPYEAFGFAIAGTVNTFDNNARTVAEAIKRGSPDFLLILDNPSSAMAFAGLFPNTKFPIFSTPSEPEKTKSGFITEPYYCLTIVSDEKMKSAALLESQQFQQCRDAFFSAPNKTFADMPSQNASNTVANKQSIPETLLAHIIAVNIATLAGDRDQQAWLKENVAKLSQNPQIPILLVCHRLQVKSNNQDEAEIISRILSNVINLDKITVILYYSNVHASLQQIKFKTTVSVLSDNSESEPHADFILTTTNSFQSVYVTAGKIEITTNHPIKSVSTHTVSNQDALTRSDLIITEGAKAIIGLPSLIDQMWLGVPTTTPKNVITQSTVKPLMWARLFAALFRHNTTPCGNAIPLRKLTPS